MGPISQNTYLKLRTRIIWPFLIWTNFLYRWRSYVYHGFSLKYHIIVTLQGKTITVFNSFMFIHLMKVTYNTLFSFSWSFYVWNIKHLCFFISIFSWHITFRKICFISNHYIKIINIKISVYQFEKFDKYCLLLLIRLLVGFAKGLI